MMETRLNCGVTEPDVHRSIPKLQTTPRAWREAGRVKEGWSGKRQNQENASATKPHNKVNVQICLFQAGGRNARTPHMSSRYVCNPVDHECKPCDSPIASFLSKC